MAILARHARCSSRDQIRPVRLTLHTVRPLSYKRHENKHATHPARIRESPRVVGRARRGARRLSSFGPRVRRRGSRCVSPSSRALQRGSWRRAVLGRLASSSDAARNQAGQWWSVADQVAVGRRNASASVRAVRASDHAVCPASSEVRGTPRKTRNAQHDLGAACSVLGRASSSEQGSSAQGHALAQHGFLKPFTANSWLRHAVSH